MTSADFRILGPLEVWLGAGRLRLRGRRQEKVLAALLVDAGRVVPLARLVDAGWEGEPPATARHQVQDLVTRLRRALVAGGAAPDVLRTESGGYVLDVPAEAIDARRFERLVGTARELARGGDPAAAVPVLRDALALWRGAALAGIGSSALAAAAAGWDERRLAAWEDCLARELELGRHADVAGELAELVERQPYRERLVELTMLALYRSGRRAEALAAYRRLADRLRDELGLDPSAELRGRHEQMLRGDTSLQPGPGPADPPGAPGPDAGPPDRTADVLGPAPPAGAADGPRPRRPPALVSPAQLPADVPAFTGRVAELARLDGLLAADRPAAMPICAVIGPAGVGKTSLAVHWAHRIAGQFPDGQLYVNLRGFGPSGAAVRPAEAVRGFLDALAVPADRIPAELDAQVGLYRSVVAGQRVLVLLDNARDAEQVRPLLPGAPGCLVIATSRDQLAGLVAAAGALPVELDLMTAEEARQLLTRRLGAARVAAEPAAAAEIVDRCARLPLALAVVAGRAAARPGFGLTTLAIELREAQGGLAAFAGGDPATDVRAVLSWSYHALTPPAARLFRLLAVHPGPDIGLAAAASLAGTPVAEVRPLLAELTRAHLVEEHAPGRYAFHDLLRAYAAELAGGPDADAEPRAAVRRLLDHYLHSGYAADRLIYPQREPIRLVVPAPGVTPETFADPDRAAAWFDTEHPVLLAAADLAGRSGFDDRAWRLAWTLQTFLERRGRWIESVTTSRAGLAAATRLADRPGQARAHRSLATAQTALGRPHEADAHCRQALTLYRDLGDLAGEAHTERNLAAAYDGRGLNAEALVHALRALDLYRRAGDRQGQAYAFSTAGWCHARLGDQQAALAACWQALALLRDLGDRWGEAATWDSIGYAQHQLGQHDQAAKGYRRALALLRDLGDRHREAVVLGHIGDTALAAGDVATARRAWQDALDIFTDLDHPDAADIRAKLARGAHPIAAGG
ncbi:MAG: hypothetical protein V7637_736 [Mycobacteriales bacterium]|jgi:DNA-binding SARP family transcriptional activator/tetratricopeptide (TPR) repeat protein